VKDEIVAYHNKKRSQVSPPATNMKTMQWDDNLARLAQKWSEGCLWKHGQPPEKSETVGPDGRKFDWLGQNLAIGTAPYTYKQSIDVWYNETNDYDYCKNAKKEPSAMIGHYTAMVWENTTHVGCGSHYCSKVVGSTKKIEYADYVTCNYWPGGNLVINGVERRPYRTKPECVCDPEACSNKTEKNLDGDSPNNANTFNIVFVAAVAVASTLVNL